MGSQSVPCLLHRDSKISIIGIATSVGSPDLPIVAINQDDGSLVDMFVIHIDLKKGHHFVTI